MDEAPNPFETPRSDSAAFSKSRSWRRTIAGTIATILLLYGMLGVAAGIHFFGTNAFTMLRLNPVYVMRFFAVPIIALLSGVMFLKRALRPNR